MDEVLAEQDAVSLFEVVFHFKFFSSFFFIEILSSVAHKMATPVVQFGRV